MTAICLGQAQASTSPDEIEYRNAAGRWIIQGGDLGVFESSDNGTSWFRPAGAGLNLAVVKECDEETTAGSVVACWMMPVNLNTIEPANLGILTDLLPRDTVFVDAFPEPGFVSGEGDRARWSALSLAPGFNSDCYYEYLNWKVDPFAGPFNPQTNPVCSGDFPGFEQATIFYLSYRVNVPVQAGAKLVNTARFSADVPGFSLEQVTADYVTSVRGGAVALGLTISDSPDPAVPGEQVLFDVSYAHLSESSEPLANACILSLNYPEGWGDPQIFDLGDLGRGQNGQVQGAATVPLAALPGFRGTTIASLECLQGGVSASNQTLVKSVDNNPPIAVPDRVTLMVGTITPIDVLANDSDVDEDSLAVVAITQPQKGTVSLQAGGLGVFYQSKADAEGVDSFTYSISDGRGGLSTANVSVTVIGSTGVKPLSLTARPISRLGIRNLFAVSDAVPERKVTFWWSRVPQYPPAITSCGQLASLVNPNIKRADVIASDSGTAESVKSILKKPIWILATQELDNGTCGISNMVQLF
ncbi:MULTISPECIES: cadherin-like domain-containing protein [unclassified Thiocapsa]|uniref:cadherin-like domain-containing protein n=1 Tax=unclassified Thiocapsa TaxID=2641286 RepID=UPI0035B351DB